ncbi:MAG: SET domain-containing protein [Planctomycetia bacterium]|nr:SET domain-containing protein [Planctomycetia bacterium]
MTHHHTPVLETPRDRLMRLVRLGQTHVGTGVFARRRLKSGIVLGEIQGTVLDEHPADSSYCMELQCGKVLEPAPPLRFVNHSCDPNCELFYWFDEELGTQEDRLWLQTIRCIEPGEELSIDYCWPADAAIPCRCQASNCRAWIVDPDELHLITSPADQTLHNPTH